MDHFDGTSFSGFRRERGDLKFKYKTCACLTCLTLVAMLIWTYSKCLESEPSNISSRLLMNVDLPEELLEGIIRRIKNGISEYGFSESNESGSMIDSELRAYDSKVKSHFFRKNGLKVIKQAFRSSLKPDLNEEFMDGCENGTSICRYELSVQERPYKAPDGCAVISTEDLSWPDIKSKNESTVVSICVPAAVGSIKLDAAYLQKINLINSDGKSKVSYVSAGEGTNVAIFIDDEFEGNSYVLSGKFAMRNLPLHNWKRNSNDNVKSLIIHSTLFSKRPSKLLFPSSPKACDCFMGTDAFHH